MTEFEKVYREYYGDVYRYLLRLSGDESIAEEITCETFFRSMEALKKFRGDCEIRVWLCQIAKNCYYTYLKRTGRVQYADGEELSEIPQDGMTTEETVIQKDDVNRVRQVLHHMPEPYKEVFMWRVFAELSFGQIGKIFGKSENWACVTYHRAKGMIRSRMEASDSDK